MLKYICKVLSISLMSGSLMMMDFNFKTLSLSQASAQTSTTTPTPTEKAQAEADKAAVQAQSNTASVYRTNSTEPKKEILKNEAIKEDSNIMGTLTMTAVGVLTQRLWKCKLTTDMMVAAAGGALYVGGEVLAFLKLKKVMKDMETEIVRNKDGKLDQKQIETLETLKKSYVEAKKTANTKKMLQQAAAAAFAAAGALALTQSMTETAAETACTTALQSAAVACNAQGTSLAAGTYTAPLAPPYFSGAAQAQTCLANETMADMLEKATVPSMTLFSQATVSDKKNTTMESTASAQCPMISAATATCEGKRTIKMMTRGVCPVAPSVVNMPSGKAGIFYAGITNEKPKTNPIFDIISKYFLSEAQANLFSPMGIASSAAISYLLATSATLGVTIDTFLFAPMNRAMVWGVLAGLTFMATSATDNVIAQLDANIAKIDAILNGLNGLGAGTALANVTIKNPAIQQKPVSTPLTINSLEYTNEDINLDDMPGGKLPCYTGGDEKKCTSFEDQIKADAGYAGLNVPSKNLITGIMKTADGFNGRTKITSASMLNASKLAGNANALNANLKKNKDALRDLLKKRKIDLNKRENEFSNAIEKSSRSQLKKSNMSAGQMLGSMYGGSAFPESKGTVAAVPGQDAVGDKAPDLANAAGGLIDINATAGMGETDLGVTGLNNGEMSAEEKAQQEAAALAAANAAGATSIDDFELKNDITKDKESSIFDLISNRYQKSGYPRLFKRIK